MPIDIKVRRNMPAALKTAGKLSIRTVQGEIRTADRTLKTVRREQSRQDDGSTGYAVNRVSDAERITARKLDNRGRKAVRYSKRRIRRGIADRRARAKARAAEKEKEKEKSTERQGGRESSRETAPTDRSREQRRTAAATRREAARQQAIKIAQKQEMRSVKGVLGKIGDIFKKVGKVGGKIISAFNFAIAGVWLLAMLIIAVGVIGAVVMYMDSPDEADIEYSEAGAAVYYFLRTKMGLNPAASCAVMANIEAESGFSINALGDEGTSYGLCQWHNSRWDRLNEFCAQNDYYAGSIQGQLYYFQWELENFYPHVMEYLREVDDDAGGCYDAASYFCINFERPDNAESKGKERGEIAVQSYWYSYGVLDEEWSKQGMALALTAYMELGNEGGLPYWRWYGFKQRVEWCAIFVSWCAAQNGYIAAGIMPLNADIGNVDTGYEWYYRNGESFGADPDIEPQPGWIAFFGRGHTGIVYACDGVNVYLVEGNSMDAVRINQYPLEDVHNFLWWSIPPYTE